MANRSLVWSSTVVIACGSRKLDRPAPARDLYTGSLFRLARGAAERDGRPWLILSALYGLVAPDQVIAPYDKTLRTSADVATLAHTITAQPDPGPVEAWVPARYVDALHLAGLTVTATPLRGMGKGWQGHWFKEHAA